MTVRRLDRPQVDWPTDAVPDADYTDGFEARVARADDAVAEEWIRRTLEGAPAALRWFMTFGWRWVLGFRPSRSGGILGWRIMAASDDAIVLEQRSSLVAAALLLRVTPTGLTWGTRVRFESRAARPVWALVGALHRRIVPYVLGRAAARPSTPARP